MNRPLGICNHIVHTDEQYNIVLVASGITVGECIKAAKILQNDGFGVCVVNIIHHNKISEILGLLADVPILTVYNGVKEVLQGPLAMAAMEDSPYRSSQILGLGFTEGLTGSTAELLQYYGLDSVGIYRKAYEILNAKKPLK
jgi:transketolase C-terminal domain/subunit